jgi:hypothetical protein
VLDRFTINHDRQGLGELVSRLHKRHAEIRIAIERPSGLLVDTLVEASFTVVPIHPNVVKACRPRYRAVSAYRKEEAFFRAFCSMQLCRRPNSVAGPEKKPISKGQWAQSGAQQAFSRGPLLRQNAPFPGR